MQKPKVLVLRTAGTNCDFETQYAFEKAGAVAERVHINRILEDKGSLHNYHIIAIPGGFTYGDDVAAGRIFANELYFNLKEEIDKFINDGKLIIGICNGFQVLVKAGFLPIIKNGKQSTHAFDLNATLTFNDSGKFEDRWIYLKACSTKTPFVNEGDDIYIPVANAEGKFIPGDDEVLRNLNDSNRIVYRYVNKSGEPDGYPCNPSGSIDNIAGICDSTGRVFGMMPHPERHIDPTHHPRWTREGLKDEGEGIVIFRNGVDYIKKHWN
ncbi:MAG: phosphoribosylformylglycinamidine synthase I [Candidatus Anammoxibacter sp.]